MRLLDMRLPCLPGFLPTPRIDQVLRTTGPLDSRQTRQPGRIPIRIVHRQAGRLADLIQSVHTLPVLIGITRIHAYQRMNALAAAMHHGGAGELQRPDQGQLFPEVLMIGLDQRMTVRRDIGILAPAPVHRIDPHPGPGNGVGVAHGFHHSIPPQYLAQFRARAVAHTLLR